MRETVQELANRLQGTCTETVDYDLYTHQQKFKN